MYKECKYCGSEYTVIYSKLNIVKCNSCQLVFSKKTFSQDELKEAYDYLYNKKENSHYSAHTDSEYEKLVKGILPNIGYNREKVIKKYITKNSHVLEIGSGVGLIGKYLEEQGVTEYLGLEIDSDTYLKSKKNGLNTMNEDFQYMQEIDKQFDVIMLWEVLEHLQDLELFIQMAYERLNQNGILMFSVPNFDKIKNYKDKTRIYQDEPPIHLNFFTKKSIKNIFSEKWKIDYLYVKKRPYLNFKSKNFYKMMLKTVIGQYEGSTIYVGVKKV